MQSMLHPKSYRFHLRAVSVALIALGGLFFSSCATTSSTEPDPERPSTTTLSEAEFYTPGPSGDADDYWLFEDGEDDVDYSYYLDETHYIYVVDHENDHDGKHEKWSKRIKKGHGYGDENHIHKFWKDNNPGKRIYVRIHRHSWADDIKLTDSQKVALDSGMKAFKECAKESLDSFKVAFKPFREQFRAEKMRIIGLLNADSNAISRDSAYALLDSAIERYEDQTKLLKAGLQVELQSCYQELDAYMMTVLTPRQYEIWKSNRGW